ncbi:hypothetical protein CHUAL_009645 [Chamberlinius hualienensis]
MPVQFQIGHKHFWDCYSTSSLVAFQVSPGLCHPVSQMVLDAFPIIHNVSSLTDPMCFHSITINDPFVTAGGSLFHAIAIPTSYSNSTFGFICFSHWSGCCNWSQIVPSSSACSAAYSQFTAFTCSGDSTSPALPADPRVWGQQGVILSHLRLNTWPCTARWALWNADSQELLQFHTALPRKLWTCVEHHLVPQNLNTWLLVMSSIPGSMAQYHAGFHRMLGARCWGIIAPPTALGYT